MNPTASVSTLIKKTFGFRKQIRRKARMVLNQDVYRRILTPKEGNRLIGDLIASANPLMLTRFGSTEMLCVRDYFRDCYLPKTVAEMSNNSGFFPCETEYLNKFSNLYLDSAEAIDVLGVWFILGEANVARKFCPSASLLKIETLEPYFHAEPWSKQLEGRKVLVIHPFKDTILNNYHNRRKLIFSNENVLPDFDITCIRAVQTLAGNPSNFETWFDALDYMKSEISKTTFDIAIIGCGAYGLPLAAYVKSLGKQAIHLGGATQILFGIKGKRWDQMPTFLNLYNEHWTRPLPSDFPENFQKPKGYWNYW